MKPYIIKILEMIKPEDRHFALDLGCGNGEDVKVLKEAGFDILGVDNSHER